MFVQQYYGRSSLEGDFERAELWSDEVFTNPKLYEKFETSSSETSDGWMDMNYAGSAFIFLTLVNELQKQSISEQEAFKLVFRDFWIEKSDEANWEKVFEKTFNINIETFYERLSKYSRQDIKRYFQVSLLRSKIYSTNFFAKVIKLKVDPTRDIKSNGLIRVTYASLSNNLRKIILYTFLNFRKFVCYGYGNFVLFSG